MRARERKEPKRIEPAMYEIIKHEKTRPWGGDTSPTVNAGVHSMTKAYMADSVAAETIMIVSKRPSEPHAPEGLRDAPLALTAGLVARLLGAKPDVLRPKEANEHRRQDEAERGEVKRERLPAIVEDGIEGPGERLGDGLEWHAIDDGLGEDAHRAAGEAVEKVLAREELLQLLLR